MKIDVFFTPFGVQPHDVAGRTVVVIDVLRTTTVIAAALHNGARAVVPAASTEEALRLAQNFQRGEVLLAGELRHHKIAGFALGNSPSEFTAEQVAGKTIVMATTNGTPALVHANGAREALVAAAVNFSAVVQRARAALSESGDLAILCAGRERQFALEDAFAAGRLTKVLLPEGGLRVVCVNDGALAALEIARHFGERWLRAVKASAAAQDLIREGFADDVKACAAEDAYPVVPSYADRRITVHRAPDGR